MRCEGRIVFGHEVHSLSSTVANILPSAQRIVIDLSGIELVDSAGLGELVLLHLWAEAAGKALKFAGPLGSVRRLLELTNLLAVFDVYPTLAEAMAAMNSVEVCSA